MKSICMSTLSYFTSTFVQNEDRNLSFIWPSESIFRLMLFANDALLTCISWKRKTMYNKLLEIVMLVTLIKTFSPNFIGLCHETKGSSLLNSAGFTYRLDRLKPRASTCREPPAQVNNIFNIVVELSYICCHNVLYFLNNPSVIFLTQLHSISEYCRI